MIVVSKMTNNKLKQRNNLPETLQVFLKLIGVLLFLCFIYSSSLLASYLILHNTTFYDSLAGWEKPISIIILAYLIGCFVFFLKGIMIVMKAAKSWRWVIIWFVCFTFVCLLPSRAIYFMLEFSLGFSISAGRTGISHYKFWSLAVTVLAGAILYNRYGLTSDKSIKITSWAYKLGISTGIRLLKTKP